MIFDDSNVPVYLVGAEHPNRQRASDFVSAHTGATFVTSAEVYQECVHRYVAIDRRSGISDCFRLLDDLVDHVYPVTREDVLVAARIAGQQRRRSGRDCLVLATMERYGIERVFSFDRDLEIWPNVARVPH